MVKGCETGKQKEGFDIFSHLARIEPTTSGLPGVSSTSSSPFSSSSSRGTSDILKSLRAAPDLTLQKSRMPQKEQNDFFSTKKQAAEKHFCLFHFFVSCSPSDSWTFCQRNAHVVSAAADAAVVTDDVAVDSGVVAPDVAVDGVVVTADVTVVDDYFPAVVNAAAAATVVEVAVDAVVVDASVVTGTVANAAVAVTAYVRLFFFCCYHYFCCYSCCSSCCYCCSC